jgi:hypothetical protein
VQNDDDPVTRQMVDKRQSRKDNGPSFQAALATYRAGGSEIPGRLEKGLAVKAAQGLLPKNDGLGVPVYLRKRPLFAHEVSLPATARSNPHNCVLRWDCIKP